ncbi:MAG: LysR family transcriptional regulator [Proteobacteria bacterium]|nr:MAG: LysR family transcriptional regulator [Pseudomonadota bacterium]
MINTRIDLNLFQVFITIYNEGNLTRASEALHLTQPAVSHSLARLRAAFDDPLFVRRGTRMEPTSLARNIIDDVRYSIATLQSTLQPQSVYDYANSTRTFQLCLRDNTEAACLPELMAFLEKNAPGVRIVSQRVERKRIESLLTSGKLDFAMDVFIPFSDTIRHQKFKQDRFVVVARKGHPLLDDGLGTDTYLASKHILVSTRAEGTGFEDFEFSRMGLTRQIALRCQHYFVACQAVQNTDYLLTMPESYALLLNRRLSNEIHRLPIGIAPIDIYLYWHNEIEKDAANCWLREILLDS